MYYFIQEHVSEAIKCHFKVDSVTDLGCGAVEKLLTDEKLSNQASLGITYITPLVFNSLDTGVVPTSVAGSVGSLGHQSSDSAMEWPFRRTHFWKTYTNGRIGTPSTNPRWETFRCFCGSLHENLVPRSTLLSCLPASLFE